MSDRDYVHALGEQLERASDPVMRVQLARLLAATGSPDAQPYLAEALSAEDDSDARVAIGDALHSLEDRQDQAGKSRRR